jgi:molecular chaperone GrpE
MEENKENLTEQTEQTEELTEEAAAKETEKETKKDKKADKKELLAEIEKLQAEIKEKDDKYLRMAAEYDNFRRRSREEKEGIYAGALSDTVKEILPIIDNLERAYGFEDTEKVKEGLVMIAKTTGDVLTKLGVEEFGKVGETFDPNIHNAVLHVEDEAFGEGEIVEVFQKGYKKGKHIIRFAMVKTAN